MGFVEQVPVAAVDKDHGPARGAFGQEEIKFLPGGGAVGQVKFGAGAEGLRGRLRPLPASAAGSRQRRG